MQTVNFNCPHCGNLMAVGANLLGRNVRCPHCKQVVRAPVAPGEAPSQTVAQPPVPTPPPPTPPSRPFNIPEHTEHHESIFGERHDEDVFGSEPMKPTMPSPLSAPLPPTMQEIPVPPPIPQRPAYQPPPQTPPQYQPPMHEPLAFDAPTVSVPAMQALSPPDDPYQHRVDDRPPPREREEREPYRGKPRRDEAPGTPAFAWILLIYAGIITIVAGFFGFQYFNSDDKGNHPYKAMPDVLREYSPATKKQVSFQTQPDPKLEIPNDLRVAIGDELTVGDLLVQPLSVERKKVQAITKSKVSDDKVSRLGETLVLTLRVKNVSTDTTFDPNDPAFGRALDKSQPPPYTALQVYNEFFYGTFKWPPDGEVEKQYIDGTDSEEKLLGPGEERTTTIVVAPTGARTSGNLNIIARLRDYETKPADMVWRVQLRRGVVTFNDGEKDVPASATTVVGVVFRSDQIK